jgi:hypothetical protein
MILLMFQDQFLKTERSFFSNSCHKNLQDFSQKLDVNTLERFGSNLYYSSGWG